jgi:hypothetical protein
MFQMPNELFDRELFNRLKENGRTVARAVSGDADLGPLKDLPGVWCNTLDLAGQGFNMIALPFQDAMAGDAQIDYRLLVNQYNEELTFDFVDKGVPNRGKHLDYSGIADNDPDFDQMVVALDYQQKIKQITAEDFPASGETDKFNGKFIHHEPGLWLYMLDERTNGVDLARLSTIPHGDSVLALGRSGFVPGGINYTPGEEEIPDLIQSGLPIGDTRDLKNKEDHYLDPYRHFQDCHFHGFDPINPQNILKKVRKQWDDAGINILETKAVLKVDSTLETGGIHNIPFIVKQANAASMKSTFWIMRIDDHGTEKMILQYLQIVILDFLPREDGHPGLVRWPHISINTLEKVKVF